VNAANLPNLPLARYRLTFVTLDPVRRHTTLGFPRPAPNGRSRPATRPALLGAGRLGGRWGGYFLAGRPCECLLLGGDRPGRLPVQPVARAARRAAY